MRHERGKRPTKPAAERYTIRGTDETNPERSDVVREGKVVSEKETGETADFSFIYYLFVELLKL